MTENQNKSDKSENGSTERVSSISQNEAANYARITYLLLIVFGIGAEATRTIIIESGDASVTVASIKDSELLFRMSIVSNLLMMISFLLMGQAFYILFKSVNKKYAHLLRLFITVSVPLNMLNLLNLLAVILLLNNSDITAGFTEAQVNSLIVLFLELYTYGYLIAQIFFGLWLLPLGYLVYKSGYFPKILGYFPIIGGVELLIGTFMFILFPDFYKTLEPIGLAIGGIGELSFAIWFIVRGPKLREVR